VTTGVPSCTAIGPFRSALVRGSKPFSLVTLTFFGVLRFRGCDAWRMSWENVVR
jgi:hypothetical protein